MVLGDFQAGAHSRGRAIDDCRLWIRDEHINAAIANAVKNHDLKVFIWDTGANLMDRVRAAPHGAAIWSGVLSSATRPMMEVFPTNQAETQEYRRILETLFG